MNNPGINKNMTKAQLLRAIEQYFDCELSDADERSLRDVLADSSWRFDEAEEARAVMGIHNPRRLRKPGVAVSRFRTWGGVAAAVAVLLCVGTVLIDRPAVAEEVCVAYVNGNMVTDSDEVMALMSRELAALSPSVDACENNLMFDF